MLSYYMIYYEKIRKIMQRTGWKFYLVVILKTNKPVKHNLSFITPPNYASAPVLSLSLYQSTGINIRTGMFSRYSFRYVFDKKHSKNARNLCLLQWTVLNTSLLTCKLRASAHLRRCEIVTMRQNSRYFLLRRHWESHSHRHLLNKTMFLL